MHQTIESYLPRLELDGLSVDYVGIRLKLIPPGVGSQELVCRGQIIRIHSWVEMSLAIIANDRLAGHQNSMTDVTPSLAIAERVTEKLV